MANFTTHIAVGTLVSGALATVTLAADVVHPENLIAVTMAGVLGSVLPDIDLKDSRPSRAFFGGLAVFFSFVALFTTAGKYSIAEMMLLWLGTLLFVRYFVKWVFHQMSYHRGIWHSWLAAFFCALATAAFYYWVLKRNDGVAWLAGGFMLAGFLTHLVLDEIYSVDIMDTRIKASFGTALKVFDMKHPGHSIAMATAVVLAYLVTPPTRTFVEGMSSKPMWSSLQSRALPPDYSVWFGYDIRKIGDSIPVLAKRANTATVPAAVPQGNPLSTGTVAPQTKAD